MEKDSDKRVIVSGFEHMDALIRFYFGIDPNSLDVDEYAKTWADLEFALIFDGKLAQGNPRENAPSNMDN